MRIKPLFFILILALSFFSACSRANDAQDRAPDFTLEKLDGEKIVLSEILKKKMVVLDFWASWCPQCVKTIPDLEKFYQEFKDKKVEVIGVNVGESKEKVESFVRQRELSYTIVLDTDSSVAKLYNVRGIPTFVAINKKAKVLYYGHSLGEMKEKVDFK